MLIKQVNQNSVISFHFFHYLFTILNKGLKFQIDVQNGCYDVLMMSVNFNDIAILNIRGVDYRCIINRIRKSDTVNLQQNADLTEDERVL